MASIEITTMTVPDRSSAPGKGFEYPRIIGYVDPNTTLARQLVGIPDYLEGLTVDERTLSLPTGVGQYFLWALRRMSDPRRGSFNCHGLAQYVARPRGNFRAAIDGFSQEEFSEAPDLRLEMGRIGVIGVPGKGAYHSLIGLGEDSGESLQILSPGGELTVMETDKVLESYKTVRPTANLYRYEPAIA